MENKPFKIEKIEKIVDNKENFELMECLKKLEKNFVSIGEGGNANIYVADGTVFEKICFKKIKKNPQIQYNNIDAEHEYQMKVKNLGVRTPLTLMSFKTEEGEEYLVMEKIEGPNLKEAIDNPSLVPDNFNYKDFCKSLDDQISKMHNDGRMLEGVYHRDLHLKNVMIDKDGLPVIIDFGTAVQGTGSDATYEESVSMFDEKKGRYDFVNGYFKDDLEMVRIIKSELKIFMKE